MNYDLVIWTQPSGPLCLWQCFFSFLCFRLGWVHVTLRNKNNIGHPGPMPGPTCQVKLGLVWLQEDKLHFHLGISFFIHLLVRHHNIYGHLNKNSRLVQLKSGVMALSDAHCDVKFINKVNVVDCHSRPICAQTDPRRKLRHPRLSVPHKKTETRNITQLGQYHIWFQCLFSYEIGFELNKLADKDGDGDWHPKNHEKLTVSWGWGV